MSQESPLRALRGWSLDTHVAPPVRSLPGFSRKDRRAERVRLAHVECVGRRLTVLAVEGTRAARILAAFPTEERR